MTKLPSLESKMSGPKANQLETFISVDLGNHANTARASSSTAEFSTQPNSTIDQRDVYKQSPFSPIYESTIHENPSTSSNHVIPITGDSADTNRCSNDYLLKGVYNDQLLQQDLSAMRNNLNRVAKFASCTCCIMAVLFLFMFILIIGLHDSQGKEIRYRMT